PASKAVAILSKTAISNEMGAVATKCLSSIAKPRDHFAEVTQIQVSPECWNVDHRIMRPPDGQSSATLRCVRIEFAVVDSDEKLRREFVHRAVHFLAYGREIRANAL